ncbi:hypothetical protein QF001_004999 [Paraburkholderia youngii]
MRTINSGGIDGRARVAVERRKVTAQVISVEQMIDPTQKVVMRDMTVQLK